MNLVWVNIKTFHSITHTIHSIYPHQDGLIQQTRIIPISVKRMQFCPFIHVHWLAPGLFFLHKSCYLKRRVFSATTCSD